MTPQSAKAKGKRFEEVVCQEIEKMGLGFAHREIGSGSGKRKGDIFSNLPFLFEVKNQKALNWWESINQAKRQAQEGNWHQDKWALVIRDPKTSETNPNCYALIDMWQFLELLKKDQEPKIKEPDRELKWKLENLKNTISQVLKEL